MQRLEVRGTAQPIYGSLGVKRLMIFILLIYGCFFKKCGHDNKYLAHYFRCVLLYKVRYMPYSLHDAESF